MNCYATFSYIDLSHNALTNVIEPNFDGLYSLRELYLNHNQIKSIVSAAFRHASRLQILSLAHNRLEGKSYGYFKVSFTDQTTLHCELS